MAGFGLPNFGQLTEAFRKAQQIQQDAQKLQEELDAMELEGKSADGQVSVWLSGNQQPLRVRNAYELSTGTMRERMEDLTGGLDLNLPGLGG